jgi:hypothetical protein
VCPIELRINALTSGSDGDKTTDSHLKIQVEIEVALRGRHGTVSVGESGLLPKLDSPRMRFGGFYASKMLELRDDLFFRVQKVWDEFTGACLGG